MRAETWYSAEEAVEAKLADEVRGKEARSPVTILIFLFSPMPDGTTPRHQLIPNP